MVPPSNPKLMARVLEAVTHLGEGKGSLTRDVLRFVKQNSSQPPRNLTMQVRRALKHAVNAGLLRFKSGRYKMQLELNPVSHRHRHEDAAQYKKREASNKMPKNDELPMNDIDLTRKVQDQRNKASHKKRSAQKVRKRSRTRGAKRKGARGRTTAIDKRARNMNKRPKRKTTKNDSAAEDWPTRKRRMMSQPKFDDDDDDNEEEEEEEEEEGDVRETRGRPRMKSVHEDRYSDVSGDSSAVGRHRSRRSKHLANVENRSPSRRGNGDSESHRKSSKRSTSRRRRSQPRQRESRQIPATEEPTEENKELMDEGRGNEAMEMDEDQADVEGSGTPPENQGLE